MMNEMRSLEDRKGGGLSILFEESSQFFLERKKERTFRDCIEVKGKIGKEKINLAVVYMGTGNDRDVLEQNWKMMKFIMEGVEKAEREEESYIVVGDFNCHLGYIGYQEENENGKQVNRFIEESGLILLNIDGKSQGRYTWQRGEQKSVIDLGLINEKGYRMFKKMTIDEDRERVDISDHCIIEIELNIQKRAEKMEGWKEKTYYSMNNDKMIRYKREVEEKITETEDITMVKINKIIEKAAEEHLKTRYRKKVDSEGREEPPWMNEDIRREIAKRRRMNKEHRKIQEIESKELAWTAYKEQKENVRRMISEEMGKYERRTAEDIKGRRRGKDIWNIIHKLKGGRIKEKEDLKLYTEEGVEIDENKCKEEIIKVWQGIYKMHRNRMGEEWNDQKKLEYELKIREARERETRQNEMWLPRIGDPYRNIKVMTMEIQKEDIEKVLRRLKGRKAGGLDGLKPEMYKVLGESGECVEAMRRAMEKVLEEGGEPDSWRKSRTVMIEKNKKPTAYQLRPIALTDVSYKMMMSVMKEKIEEHIEENGMRKGEQAGFTGGGEILDNLLILQECVRQAYSRKEELVIIAVDFKKAYDSIKRQKLIEVMKDYKMPMEMIDLLMRLYSGDMTSVKVGKVEVDMEVDSGIRQGCTASPVLFKLITYRIIEELRTRMEGIRIGGKSINSLFFADDGLLLTKGIEEARNMVKIMRTTAEKYGLTMNNDKSKCIRYNEKEYVDNVEGIEVVKEIKYLGVKVENKKGLYDGHRKRMVEKAKKMSSMAYSVIEKSCHKVVIGKVYWKSVVLPGVLFAMEIVDIREEDIEKMQRQENVMMRRMLRAPKYAAIAGMRGEIGIGTMKSRVVRGRLQYLRRKLQGKNELVIKTIENMRENKVGWWKRTEKYLEWAGMTWEQIEVATEEEVRRNIAVRVEEEWRTELQQRSTLWLYRMYKGEMREEDYEGGERSRAWFRARTNCMWLGDRSEVEERCLVCGADVVEDLRHFMLECGELEEERRRAVELQRPQGENSVEIMGRYLFGEKEGEERRKTVLLNMWRRRKNILETNM